MIFEAGLGGEMGEARQRVRVVIVGGGTAGWMTAAALAALIPGAAEVHLVESDAIGIVGVGEATLPALRAFIARLGIDEAAFMAATSATYKLGIAFEDFGRPGDRYLHPFGQFGAPFAGVAFHHYWLRRHAAGAALPIGAYSTAVAAAEADRFALPGSDDDPIASYGYAYHFDATLFAPFLRDFALAHGARRSEGRVVEVTRDPASGDVRGLVLDDGREVSGDLFVDCSGFRALLIDAMRGAAWHDWSRWLPCDRAVALSCAPPPGAVAPYTRAIAMPAGWRWRIPLRQRVGNGYVYSSTHCDDARAADALLAAIEGQPLAEPRLLRFTAGRRTAGWVGNVVAIGLSSGFLEPLESTSLYLVQAAITQLIERFPDSRPAAADRAAFNAAIDAEYDRVRDFLILHYHATTRADSAFWNDVRTMAVPDSLRDRIALWRRTAQVPAYGHGLFLEPSWVAVLLGQGIVPDGWDTRADLPEPASLDRAMAAFRRAVEQRVAAMPDHRAALNRGRAAA